MAAVIASGRRAVLLDLAGHGQSEPVSTTTSELGDDVIALLDVLEAEQAVICELSLGWHGDAATIPSG